ncbi:chitin biosynthesis protein [Moniliophthora roreri]|uniref:Putative fibronectin type III/BRCA1 domain-containing protein n=1 Tax=Moniliophthora roreri TaxID=221103 RepID=A0A0W0FLS4_MONRR|nr:chitin biosynthesis protein [Moniliophthora roreri]
MSKAQESFTFTVGKLDAGMAILLGERAHLIEFPSILLPPGATTGSIVNIAVYQNHAEEKRREAEFWALQDDILEAFGRDIPEAPKLQLRNVTQTSVTLEWPALKLATAKLRSLDIYRNGQRLAAIPSPLTNTSTKLSGLDLNSEYTFQLILRTTAGTYPSNLIRVRTHTMTDTSGISVCFGNVEDAVMLENAKMALREMGAKWSEKIQIDTTHFVCTTPAATPSGAQASGIVGGAPGVEYQRALQLSIPVVMPHWILACHSEKKMVAIANYYLGAEPPTNASTHFRPQSMSSTPRSPGSPSQAPTSSRSPTRSSMPPPARKSSATPPTPNSTFVGQPPETPREQPIQEQAEEGDGEEVQLGRASDEDPAPTPKSAKRKSRTGTMNRDFKFPSPVLSQDEGVPATLKEAAASGDEPVQRVITPSSIEVPPPPPVEKERSTGDEDESDEEDVGPTEEVPL